MENFDIVSRMKGIAGHAARAGDNTACTIKLAGLDLTVEVKVGSGRIIVACGCDYDLDPLEAVIAASRGEVDEARPDVGELASLAWSMASAMPLTVEVAEEAVYLEIDNSRSTALTAHTVEGVRCVVVEFANSAAKYVFPIQDQDSYKTYVADIKGLYRMIQARG